MPRPSRGRGWCRVGAWLPAPCRPTGGSARSPCPAAPSCGGAACRTALPDGREPDFGLYLGVDYRPRWDHERLEWPDFGLPRDPLGRGPRDRGALRARPRRGVRRGRLPSRQGAHRHRHRLPRRARRPAGEPRGRLDPGPLPPPRGPDPVAAALGPALPRSPRARRRRVSAARSAVGGQPADAAEVATYTVLVASRPCSGLAKVTTSRADVAKHPASTAVNVGVGRVVGPQREDPTGVQAVGEAAAAPPARRTRRGRVQQVARRVVDVDHDAWNGARGRPGRGPRRSTIAKKSPCTSGTAGRRR